MSTADGLDDWGLLSVADVIDSIADSNRCESLNAEKTSVNSAEQATLPSFLLTESLAHHLQNDLLSALRGRFASRSSRIENIFGMRLKKLKHSLASSKLIRERLSGATESIGSCLPVEEKIPSMLATIALLGSVIDDESNSSYCSALLDGVAQIKLDAASPSSCLEIFRVLEEHTSEESLPGNLGEKIAFAKMSLALRSGRLSAVLKCLLASTSRCKLHEPLVIPQSSWRTTVVATSTMDDFLVKSCTLPAHFRIRDAIRCFATAKVLRVFCGSYLARYEAMGLMGTRLLGREERMVRCERGATLLYLGGDYKSVLTVRSVSRDAEFWYIDISLIHYSSDTEEAKGRLALRTAGLSLTGGRTHFSLRGSNTICCLLSTHPPQRTRSCLYVGAIPLDTVLHSCSNGVAVMELSPLRRNPCAHITSSKHMALHFTKPFSVSIGCVTLKKDFHPFCIELWVYPRSISDSQTILSIGDKGVDEILIELEPAGDGVLWKGGARTPQLGSSFTSYNSPGKLSSLERWWHVALNFTGTMWELFLDHTMVGRQTALVFPAAIENAKCVVGKGFVGMIAEVRVWQQTRTAAQLSRDATRPLSGTEPGLCGYYPLNEGQGNVLMDYSPRNEHALLSHGAASWCTIDHVPITTRSAEARWMPDFVPQTWVEEPEDLFFTATLHAYAVVGVRSDHTMNIAYYSQEHFDLIAQRSIELPSKWHLKGVSSHDLRESVLCWAISDGSPSAVAPTQLFLWEVWPCSGELDAVPHVPYTTLWSCGKALLSRSALHAQRFLAVEQYLTDQSSWATSIPQFLVDPDDDVLTLLLRVAATALIPPTQDRQLAQEACLLLQLNLFARYYRSRSQFAQSVGRCYDSVEELLSKACDAKLVPSLGLRDAVVSLSFDPEVRESTQLLSGCCQCFLPESKRISFIKSESGKSRAPREEAVYSCLLVLYSSLHTCHDALESNPAYMSALFTALFLESTYQVDHSLRAQCFDGLRRTSHCLEVVQEVLLSRMSSTSSDSAALEQLKSAYSIALLRSCEKIISAVSKAVRQLPKAEGAFAKCLQLSPVGALLASFSVSLPLLPTAALEVCSKHLQQCRESLVTLANSLQGDQAKRWAFNLSIAVTFSIGQLGCTLLSPMPPNESRDIAGDPAMVSYTNILRGGQRKTNSERDVLVKNVQRGVGSISKVFEELQRKDVSALRVVRDEQLRDAERQVMAACCALLLPTSAMREATAENLSPAFSLVLKLRPWILSKRQESKEYVAQVAQRAVFLAQFELAADVDSGEATTNTSTPSTQPISSQQKRRFGDKHAASSDRHRWKKLFRSWKAMRLLKTLASSKEEGAHVNISTEIVSCFQSEIPTTEMEAVVDWRSQKAQYRLTGLQLLRQLVEESRRSTLLARVLHPVIARTLCGWHYSEGVEGCSVEQLSRLQSAYFLLFDLVIQTYLESPQEKAWALLLTALFSSPLRAMDLRKLRSASISIAFRQLWDCDKNVEVLYRRVNGCLPSDIRSTTLTTGCCSPTIVVGDSGLTLRSSGGRGTCVAPCTWRLPQRSDRVMYYFEVQVIDLYQSSYVGVGVGPADYSLSQMPGWDPDSFAYEGHEGTVYSSRNARVMGPTFGIGDVVGCGWNTDKNEVYWTRNGRYLFCVEAAPPPEQICPLIGIKGKGSIAVNFGAKAFMYRQFVTLIPSLPNTGKRVPTDELSVSRDAWDTFVVFSIQAVTTLNTACSRPPSFAGSSLADLVAPIGYCLDALMEALSVAASEPLQQQSLPHRYLSMLLDHISLLTKLLRDVPGDIMGLHSTRLEEMLRRVATQWLLVASRNSLYTAEENEVLTSLLIAWFYTMHLTPPTLSAVSSPPQGPVASENLPPSEFLRILLLLASCIITTSDTRMSASDTRHSLDVGHLGIITPSDTVHWLALSLLQRMCSDVDPQSRHSWQGAAHQWLLKTLKRAGTYDLPSRQVPRDVLLALAVLGGIPRLAVPGDTVTAHLDKRTTAPVLLLDVSWSEEICDVLEFRGTEADGEASSSLRSSRKLPLRFVEAYVRGDYPLNSTFPAKDCAVHKELAVEVTQLSCAWLPVLDLSSISSEEVCLAAQISTVLARCVDRRVLTIPADLITSLSNMAAMAEDVATNMDQVHLEVVLNLWGLLQCRQRRGLPRHSVSAGKAWSDGETPRSTVRAPEAVADLTPATLQLRTFAAFDHLLSGNGLDIEEEEEEEEEEDEDDDVDDDIEGPYEEGEDDGMDSLDDDHDDEEGDLLNSDGNDADDDRGDSGGGGGRRSNRGAGDGWRNCASFPSTPDALFLGAGNDTFDGIHFSEGCLRIMSSRPVGLSFTIDMLLRMTDIHRHQILFAQVTTATTSLSPMEMVARIFEGRMEFGCLPCLRGEEFSTSSISANASMCSFPLDPTDKDTWIRMSFVQSGTTLSLFRSGVLRDTKKMTHGGVSLLNEELHFGGIPGHVSTTSFSGDMKSVRVYELALRPAMVEQLRRLNSSLSTFLESHLSIVLKATRYGVENSSKAPASVVLDVLTEGQVGYLDESAAATARQRRNAESCLTEVDFGAESQEADLRSFADPLPSLQATLWRKKRGFGKEHLLSDCTTCYRQLIAFYSAHILAHAFVASVPQHGEIGSSAASVVLAAHQTLEAVKEGQCVPRIVYWAVSACGNDLTTVLKGVWPLVSKEAQRHHNISSANRVVLDLSNKLLEELLRVAQQEQRSRVYESSHPQRPFSSDVYEVNVSSQSSYQVYLDTRSAPSWRLITVSADRSQGALLTEFYGTALSSFEVRLPFFFLTVQSAMETSDWGHRIAVVYDYAAQLRAMRLFRTALSVLLSADYRGTSESYLWTTNCLQDLTNVVKKNTGKTRLIALTCLCDLFLFVQRYKPASLTSYSVLHDIRRMAERHYRRRLVSQGMLSRFVQVTAECYVMQRDAMHCGLGVLNLTSEAAGSGIPKGSTSAEMESFIQHRQTQRALYRQRESGADRVNIQKLRDPQNISHEWSVEGVCLVRSESTGGSVVAGVPLTAGKWYYEVRLGGVGNVCIGVLPVPAPTDGVEPASPLSATTLEGCEPVAFNGYTGILLDEDHQERNLTHPSIWFPKDYIGVILDIPQRRCTLLINGSEKKISFTFATLAADSSAVAASTARQGLANEGALPLGVDQLAFYPYVGLEHSDSVSINFGTAYFEYEPPQGCLPLDPANLTLGTLFPYNQMRAIQDMAAHLFTGGLYPMPPFFYEEADPFAESTERVGPAYVSVHASESIRVNMEDVKNTGGTFETVVGDCAVRGGLWYFEVTLRTQGLMQIGWMARGEPLHGNGHGVGDTSTSWSVDLFRRVTWHRGIPEPVNIPRRWSVGDVIGCALDLTHGELTFFLNGRPITNNVNSIISKSPAAETPTFQSVPQGVYYVPAVSLRSGNAVSFNFGSTSFKYKPEGFNPLGVPDSWNERMDTFYANASPGRTLQRLRIMQSAWHALSPSSASGRRSSPEAAPPGTLYYDVESYETHLQPYQWVVKVVDDFCEDTSKAFTKSAEDDLRAFLAQQQYPDPSVAQKSWEFFKVLKAIAKIAQSLVPFLAINTSHQSLMSRLFLVLRRLLFRTLRKSLVDTLLKVSTSRGELYRVSINRSKAKSEPTVLKSSIFGQTFALLGAQSPRIFQTHKRFWSTIFLGEGAEDAGGPFREHLSELCRELMSTNLSLFVRTANHVHNTGSYRDAFVPAASASSSYDLEAFAFLGRIMGGALRSEEPLDLFFPPLVWRYFCCYPLTEADLEGIDSICVQCIREFRSLKTSRNSGAKQTNDDPSNEMFDDVFGEEYFVTQLSDQSKKELIEGGARVQVKLENCSEYAEALLRTRLHEFDAQLEKMREGLVSVVPETAILLLTPEELELRVCGRPDYSVEELQKGAIYEVLTGEDRRVQLLWRALEEATPLQRRFFLRFVSGRDRLPVKLRILPLSTSAEADTMLPRAATCFFAIELPDYSSLEVMKQKLYYSIENCADMDTDFNARVVDEDEAPQLSVGLDEARLEPTSALAGEDS